MPRGRREDDALGKRPQFKAVRGDCRRGNREVGLVLRTYFTSKQQFVYYLSIFLFHIDAMRIKNGGKSIQLCIGFSESWDISGNQGSSPMDKVKSAQSKESSPGHSMPEGTWLHSGIKSYAFFLSMNLKADRKPWLFFLLVKGIFALPRGIVEPRFTLQIQGKLSHAPKALPSHGWNKFTKRYPLGFWIFKTILHHYHLLCDFPAIYHPKIQWGGK